MTRHFGFVLFEEASEVRGMPKDVWLALFRGEDRKSPWHLAVKRALQRLGGAGSLADIYRAIEGDVPRRIATWKDTVRRVLQEGGFRSISRGVWGLPVAAASA